MPHQNVRSLQLSFTNWTQPSQSLTQLFFDDSLTKAGKAPLRIHAFRPHTFCVFLCVARRHLRMVLTIFGTQKEMGESQLHADWKMDESQGVSRSARNSMKLMLLTSQENMKRSPPTMNNSVQTIHFFYTYRRILTLGKCFFVNYGSLVSDPGSRHKPFIHHSYLTQVYKGSNIIWTWGDPPAECLQTAWRCT